MHQLIVNPDTGSQWEIPLPSGSTFLGRASAPGQVQIDHPSVGERHAEVVVDDIGCLFRDLRSGSISQVDGQPIEEGYVQPGQSIQLGDVLMRLAVTASQPRIASHPATGSIPEGKLFCRNHRQAPALNFCPACQKGFCSLCVSSRAGKTFCRTCGGECQPVDPTIALTADEEPSFYAQIPGCFAYPFKGNGIWMMIIGSILGALVSFAANFSIVAYVLLVGYAVLYAQGIIQASCQGDGSGPQWPSTDGGFMGSLVPAMLSYTVVTLICFLPAIICAFWGAKQDPTWAIASAVFIALGFAYLPMALLSTAMLDSISAVNPVLVVPAILKIPGAYLTTLLVLGVLTGIKAAIQLALESIIPIPIVPDAVASIFAFYFLTVDARLLGVLYHANRERIGWFSH